MFELLPFINLTLEKVILNVDLAVITGEGVMGMNDCVKLNKN
jgi:hypothetical protein